MPDANSRKAYLAFDLGAESGRAVLGYLQSGLLRIKEVHRFPNEPVEYGGSLHWDVARLWLEMRKALSGLKQTRLEGIGVDTWGVDYALLGDGGELLQNPYHYRDSRTNGVMDEVFRIVPKEEIYRATGIQFMPINTLYQLFAHRRDTPGILDCGSTSSYDPRPFQLLADWQRCLRVHECDDHPDGRSANTFLGHGLSSIACNCPRDCSPDRRARVAGWRVTNRTCRWLCAGWSACHRTGVSRHWLGHRSDFRERRHSLSKLGNMVAAGNRN